MHTSFMLDISSKRELPVVLLIDDDMVSREVAATVLIMGGYTVHTAENGEASLRLLASGECEPEVILMDTQMPGLSGAELIAELRARSKASLYAISGSKPAAEMIKAADGFLLKPFDSKSLTRLIEGRKPQEAPAHLDPDKPVVSAETLAQLREIMPEKAVRQIYAAVIADLTVRIEALGVAIAKGNTAEVGRIGHAIKGGCGMVGATQVASLGAQLEMIPLQPEGNRLDNSAQLLRDLRVAARDLQGMLEAELPA
jgi:CheY-like chemotaxis protein